MSADARARLREEEARRLRAEQLWEELGGALCPCQRPEVTFWCESCQGKVNKIEAALSAPSVSPEAVSLILQCTACGCVFNPEPKKDACPSCRGLVFTIRGHSEVRDTS